MGEMDAMTCSELVALFEVLSAMPEGTFSFEQVGQIEGLLWENWELFSGNSEGGMARDKLLGRTENMAWNPPVISFDIERHGATVNGSVYGEIQNWTFNLSTGCARFALAGKRLLGERDTPLNAGALADEIAALILAGSDDPRLIRPSPNRVRLKINVIIPSTNAQTTSSRRKRFIAELIPRLAEQGWRKTKLGSQHVFEKIEA